MSTLKYIRPNYYNPFKSSGGQTREGKKIRNLFFVGHFSLFNIQVLNFFLLKLKMYQVYLTIDELEHKILKEPEELRLVIALIIFQVFKIKFEIFFFERTKTS